MQAKNVKESQFRSFNPKKYETPSLNVNQVIQVKEAFDFFDKDKSGSLQMKEIKEAMQILGFIEENEEDINNLIQIMDEDGDKNLDFNEFMEIIFENITKNDKEKDLRIAFQYFLDLGNDKSLADDDELKDDKDDELFKKQKFKEDKQQKTKVGNSQKNITIQMLRNIAKEVGEPIEDEELVDMFDKADKDEDDI